MIGFSLWINPYINQKRVPISNPIHDRTETPEVDLSIQIFISCGI